MPSGGRGLKCVLSVAALLVSATAARAADDDSLKVSVSPLGGYRLGGIFRSSEGGPNISLANHGSFAFAVDVQADPGSYYEVFYSRESTSLGGNGSTPINTIAEYLHIGGTVDFDDDPGSIKPYYGGGVGLTRLSPGIAPGREDTRFSLSLALGLRASLSQHFALRFETRGYFTPVGSNSALFCRSDQGGAVCQVRVRGSSFYQGDFLAGATFTF